jgi:hypothetical protein
MTFDEMMQQQAKTRRKPRDLEHKLQSACVRWYRLQYPKMKHNLFSVPNGGKRDAATAAKLKDEGALAGVADLILLKSNRFYGALLIEMKTPEGRQSESQKDWQQKITNDGYKYVVVRSFEDFQREVRQYLSDE